MGTAGSTLCFVACTLFGQRRQRRKTAVARSTKGQKPGWPFIPLGHSRSVGRSVRRSVNDAQRHGVMTCCRHDVVKGRGRNLRNLRNGTLAGLAPGLGALLQVGVDDDNALAVLLGHHSGMHSKCSLAAAALLTEKD